MLQCAIAAPSKQLGVALACRSVLDELRALWEQKLQQKGLLRDDEPRAGPSAPPALPPAPLVG